MAFRSTSKQVGLLLVIVSLMMVTVLVLNTHWAMAGPRKQGPDKPTPIPEEDDGPGMAGLSQHPSYVPETAPHMLPRHGSITSNNPAVGTTNTGQSIEIIIDGPPDGEKVIVPPGQTEVFGRVAIGSLSGSANVLYVVDVSGSTSGPSNQDCNGNGTSGDAGDDLNGDGNTGDTLDCEISGVLALNTSLFGHSGIDAGFIIFGSGSAIADVGPGAGEQEFTTPLDTDRNSNSLPDLEEVARSMDQGSVGLFSVKGVGGSTYFDPPLFSVNSAFATQPPDEQNVVYFLSDGYGSLTEGPGSPLQTAADAGIVVNTYSIGGSASGCDLTAGLGKIADTTGGTCTEVSDPTTLGSALSGTSPAGIDRVELSLNGGPPINATLDSLGNWVINPSPLTGIVLGPNIISATVYATDATTTTPATAITASVTVFGVMIAARDDAITVDQDSGPTPILVLQNDETVTGSLVIPLVITSTTPAANGVITISSDSSQVFYTPNPGFSGIDTFTYTIFNGLQTDTATVMVTVVPPPAAQPPASDPDDGGPTIPEPATIALVGLGVAGLAGYVRRRKSKAEHMHEQL